MRELLIRTATGAIFVVMVLAAMLLGRISYLALLVAVAVWCSFEFFGLARKGRFSPALLLSGMAYIIVPPALMWFFPVMGSGMAGSAEGMWDERIAPAFILIVWANDTFAYLVGISMGRHKMSERLSPKKSWEGFAGGLLGGVAVAAAIAKLWIGADVWLWMGFGLVVSMAAVAGDLIESRFKRLAGVKDSGKLLPGHGGLLDRFDAMLGAAPAAFVFFLITMLAK